ncbi:equilibrative nucleoside transporter protein [Heterobasidion irregulare TC 32-1]|uniref:Equilibrative nucleoside transporter protein n=1 Tax=Heterobasidion irregulare (strain TC 32-1) TaxID=747525 RepID=W4JSE4_HETIT|nr:equilibrative nucleoside transporter protein [Heterobasidion irregulare TC 32-1]ETW76487.1 equilibrative nucleoside transporter protein [Heterobasidion irregulare TC 32-1]
MSIQHFGKGALRVAKNYTKGYSDVQAKVREATSNDPWGPSGTQMNEIAQMSYNQNDFVEIMEMLDKRLNDKGKNWRHVFKSLTVLDYLLHAGSENVVIYFRDNIYIIKTLKEFQFVDEFGKDQGANVRQKAKDITNLLTDEARLRQERRSRASMRDRMLSTPGEADGDGEEFPGENENATRRTLKQGPKDEDELKRAIEESKKTLAEEQARAGEDRDLAQAIRLSKEEEEKRNRAVVDSNGASLFDDHSNLNPNNNLLGDPSQFNTGLQAQYTSLQPQFTSFNPYQQQAQQEAMQAEYLRQQQEWMRQQQELQAAQAQAQMQQAQQEEWMRQQQLLQMQQQQQQQQQYLAAQQQLIPQQTSFGSNNPFASFSNAPPLPSQPSPAPPASSLSNFSLPSTYETHSPHTNLSSSLSPAPISSASSSPGPSRPTRADQEHAHLANLFAAPRDDGLDTFGNIGQLRYGGTDAGRLAVQKTGAPNNGYNPFAQQQQQQQQQHQNGDQPFFSV